MDTAHYWGNNKYRRILWCEKGWRPRAIALHDYGVNYSSELLRTLYSGLAGDDGQNDQERRVVKSTSGPIFVRHKLISCYKQFAKRLLWKGYFNKSSYSTVKNATQELAHFLHFNFRFYNWPTTNIYIRVWTTSTSAAPSASRHTFLPHSLSLLLSRSLLWYSWIVNNIVCCIMLGILRH